MATSADVPGKFDVVINGQGYMTALEDQSGLYYRPRRASYGHTPTFLERTNVSGDYGDDQQQFWLTFTQRDWSLGEQQRFFKSSDPDKVRRYWLGSNIDVSKPGQATLSRALTSATAAATPVAFARFTSNSIAFLTAAKKLYFIDSTGTITGGTVTVGLANAPLSMASDGNNALFYSDGTTVRKYTSGGGDVSFSAGGAYRLTFLNNTLYGAGLTAGAGDGSLARFDTSGTKTTLFSWKGADGTTGIANPLAIAPYGGKLAILMDANYSDRPSLWIYDGSAPAKVADLPTGFAAQNMITAQGMLLISGSFVNWSGVSGTGGYKQTILYYANGTLGTLWQSNDFRVNPTTTYVPMAWRHDKVYFVDLTASGGASPSVYNLTTGGVNTTTASSITSPQYMTTTDYFIFLSGAGGTTVEVLSNPSASASAGYIATSLFDGESSLAKLFRGIKVDFDTATDGNGGSVDIAYQADSVDGAYTTLQTGAVAGTEYLLSNVTGRSISVKVTLNKGTSTSGPVLKRIYVRAVPQLQQFRRCEYILGLVGEKGRDLMTLRDGTTHTKDGTAMAADLNTAITATLPISITDRFGTYTGIIEPDQSSVIEIKPGVYLAHLVCREV